MTTPTCTVDVERAAATLLRELDRPVPEHDQEVLPGEGLTGAYR
ncbi:hypothetical protein [Micromonospora sp. WMMD987]|nr:hypothetical protein [Micromonospora sp. WMMD987]WFE94669.1 hypothetical protein O7612_25605 [Micromonospora sp. WMMD987]